MTIRVLIADDQSMVRAGFRMLLSGEPDIEVAAEARDGLEAVAKAARFKPTVILMDIRCSHTRRGSSRNALMRNNDLGPIFRLSGAWDS